MWYSTSRIVCCTSKKIIHSPLRFNYSSGKIMLQVTRRGWGTTNTWFLVMKSWIQGQCQRAHHCDNQQIGNTPWPLLLLLYLFQSNTSITSTITVLPSVCCMFYLTLNCFSCNQISMTCRLLYKGGICTDPVDRFWLHLAWHIPLRAIAKISTSYFYYVVTYGCQEREIPHFIILIFKIYQKGQYPSCYIQ